MPSPPTNLAAQLSALLLEKYHLPVSQAWLANLLNILTALGRPLPPLPALLSTAHFRLLHSDFTISLSVFSPQSLLPGDIGDVSVKERRLAGNVPVQVLDVIELGVSRWSQVEAIERVERGEEVRGREVIRTVRGATDEDVDGEAETSIDRGANGAVTASASTKRSHGPHKLFIQDADKTIVTALELGDISKIFIGDDGICIGCKVILKAGALVRRGMVMLTPETVVVLGGKIDSWDKKWREDRKKTLIGVVQKEQQERRNQR